MKYFIDREKAIDKIKKWYWDKALADTIRDTPEPLDLITNMVIMTLRELDVEEVEYDTDVEALWVENVSDSCKYDCWVYTCSNCMKTFCSRIQRCPNCLAKMKNGRKDYGANSAE